MKTTTDIKRGERALGLWREWLEKSDGPGYAAGQVDDIHCFFCHAWIEYDQHEPDCIYLRAKALIEETNE